MPMSGSATKDDASERVIWWFNVGAVSNCTVSVYIPSGDSQDVGGAPAQYFVLHGLNNDGDDPYADFTVNQTASQGQWVGAGSYPVADGQIAVKLVDRGVDNSNEHLAAAQVAVSCT